MNRLQNTSDYTMSFRQSEIMQLENRVVRDEFRMDEVNDILMERDLLDHSKETDDLIQEWHNLNSRVEQSKNRLAQLKSSTDLTEDERERLPSKYGYSNERNNIKY